jgi:hypothetical protein
MIDLGEDSIIAAIIKPTGVYMIFSPEFSNYEHVKGGPALRYIAMWVLEPNNVSFYGLDSIFEWGDKADGTSIYQGDPDKRTNMFALGGMVGSTHEPGGPWGVYKYKDYKMINIVKSYDEVGIPAILRDENDKPIDYMKFPERGPYEGKTWVNLPVVFSITQFEKTTTEKIHPAIVSTVEIKKSANKHTISVSKSKISKEIEVNSETETIKRVPRQ